MNAHKFKNMPYVGLLIKSQATLDYVQVTITTRLFTWERLKVKKAQYVQDWWAMTTVTIKYPNS